MLSAFRGQSSLGRFLQKKNILLQKALNITGQN
jgi:hypothetical protein